MADTVADAAVAAVVAAATTPTSAVSTPVVTTPVVTTPAASTVAASKVAPVVTKAVARRFRVLLTGVKLQQAIFSGQIVEVVEVG
jgi:hypothetical protein